MQTIIGTFDDKTTAQTAVDQLIAQGFKRDHVHLQGAPGLDSDITSSQSDRTVPKTDGMMSGVGHFFSNLFGSDSDDHAGKYSEAVRRGGTVVAVDAENDDDVEKASAVMTHLGTIDVDQREAQWKSKGWTGFDPKSPLLSEDEQAFERDSVPVVQEELVVGKRTINTGGLRVIKRMTETPVSKIVSLREEHATIERRPVNRAATEADFANFKEGTVEVREMAEQAVVGKTARVVEEVQIGKEASERNETVSDTVRRTDVDVERVAATDKAVPGTFSADRKATK